MVPVENVSVESSFHVTVIRVETGYILSRCIWPWSCSPDEANHKVMHARNHDRSGIKLACVYTILVAPLATCCCQLMVAQSRVAFVTAFDATHVLPFAVSLGAFIKIIEPTDLLCFKVCLCCTCASHDSTRVFVQALCLFRALVLVASSARDSMTGT